MRVTNKQLTLPQAETVELITEEKVEAVNPETKEKVSLDFSKDLFALFETLNPSRILKTPMEIDDEVSDGYVKKRLRDYYKVYYHYDAIRKFLREFSHTRLFQQLQGINNPEEALRIILDMFSPQPPKPKKQQGQGQQGDKQEQSEQGEGQQGQDDKQQEGEGEGQGQEGEGEGEGKGKGKGEGEQEEQDEQNQEGEGEGQDNQQEEDSQSQGQQKGGGSQGKNSKGKPSQGQGNNNKPQGKGEEKMDNSPETEMRDNPPDLPIDMNKFNQQMPEIEKALENNILNDEMFRGIIERQAGTGHNSLKTIEGLTKNIQKIAQNVTDETYRILDIARKVGATEQYCREEQRSPVDYPEKDWKIQNIRSVNDLPKILPYQFGYPDELFDKMLFDKDLKMKQYESRRKKKQVIYLLIDCSGSMDGRNQTVACGIALAYVKKALTESSIYFYRFFDDHPHELKKVTNEQEAQKEVKYLMDYHYSGGGTSIDTAIHQAIDDINNPKLFKQEADDKSDLYDRADILVITDGGDTVSLTKEFLEEKKIILHSFVIGMEHEQLKNLSTYYESLSDDKVRKYYDMKS